MPNKTMKLKEIIEMMELDDPRVPILKHFDAANTALMQLSDSYDQMQNNGAKALIDEMIQQLDLIKKNNKFK